MTLTNAVRERLTRRALVFASERIDSGAYDAARDILMADIAPVLEQAQRDIFQRGFARGLAERGEAQGAQTPTHVCGDPASACDTDCMERAYDAIAKREPTCECGHNEHDHALARWCLNAECSCQLFAPADPGGGS